MSYIYRLVGEDIELAEAELNGFLNSQEIWEKASVREKIGETDVEPSQLKRLALVHEVSKKISENKEIEDIEPPEVNNSFAVRTENISRREIEKASIESQIGSIIKEDHNSVDLEDPERVFKAYIMKETILLGEVVEDIDRGLFKKRKNDLRPFSSPISMGPVLARVLVNLSGIKPGDRLLDPFCGTGGILIEAGLCGIDVSGRDISEEMVKGSETNLEEYGIISHDIDEKDISEIDTDGVDAIVTDLPYGQASKETEDAVESFLNTLDEFKGKTVFMYDEASIGNYEANYSIYVHKNLTRYIYVK